ncbi:hypothetical protein A5819_002794 [Enterococcus sp. 7E2_DIV0204]|uniref:hypothetical protein n=1 Tax=unclassified Enterococcus TaxID=2608891 RepID=UPI000A32B938|nr:MULTISPECIES: hypothetical protein [unclassified Enterococcus]OTN90295.1 hypothetical protein A5819_002794 [Enterococcus sp. 7E2_DIV0204]OTP52751.1 hypothetical protein A5884_001953 [Enterococcus sp. 7D2_DIV0200]
MKINLKRQTTWGCVRYFTVYKNGIRQGNLFNNIPTEMDVELGDTLEFREGLFRFSQKVVVTTDTKEISITNSYRLQQLFSLFIILFLAISLLCLSINSIQVFLAVEITSFVILNHLFRYRSYQFNVETNRPIQSLLKSISGIKPA